MTEHTLSAKSVTREVGSADSRPDWMASMSLGVVLMMRSPGSSVMSSTAYMTVPMRNRPRSDMWLIGSIALVVEEEEEEVMVKEERVDARV